MLLAVTGAVIQLLALTGSYWAVLVRWYLTTGIYYWQLYTVTGSYTVTDSYWQLLGISRNMVPYYWHLQYSYWQLLGSSHKMVPYYWHLQLFAVIHT